MHQKLLALDYNCQQYGIKIEKYFAEQGRRSLSILQWLDYVKFKFKLILPYLHAYNMYKKRLMQAWLII